MYTEVIISSLTLTNLNKLVVFVQLNIHDVPLYTGADDHSSTSIRFPFPLTLLWAFYFLSTSPKTLPQPIPHSSTGCFVSVFSNLMHASSTQLLVFSHPSLFPTVSSSLFCWWLVSHRATITCLCSSGN